jgi:hypothetical protein
MGGAASAMMVPGQPPARRPRNKEKQVPIRLLRKAQSLRAGSHRRCAPVRNDIKIRKLVVGMRFLVPLVKTRDFGMTPFKAYSVFSHAMLSVTSEH